MSTPWSTIIQDEYTRSVVMENFLTRAIHDPLYPRLLFRADCPYELWSANIGDSQVFTVQGLAPKRGRRRQPGIDPTPDVNGFEQYTATIGRYDGTQDVHHPTAIRAIVDLVMVKAAVLGAQAGQTMDAQVRNRMYAVGMSGNSWALALGSSSTSIRVACCYGFHEARASGAVRYGPLTSGNPLAITIGASTAASAIACTPDSNEPEGIYGPGTLTLAVAKTWSIRDRVFAFDGSPVYRAGGGLTMHSITASDKLTLSMVRQAVAELRNNDVPPHDDGYYHIHLDADSEQQIQNDADWKNAHVAAYDSMEFKQLVIGIVSDCIFYRNTQAPTLQSVQDLTGTGFDLDDAFPGGTVVLTNNGDVNIHRAIVTGKDVLVEKYSDPDLLYENEVQGGKIGWFDISMSGVQVLTDRVKFLWRPPQNRTMDLSSMTWLFDGDWAARTDSLTGTRARYKRARVLEHAGT